MFQCRFAAPPALCTWKSSEILRQSITDVVVSHYSRADLTGQGLNTEKIQYFKYYKILCILRLSPGCNLISLKETTVRCIMIELTKKNLVQPSH